MTQEFYNKALPDSGKNYCVAWVTDKGTMAHEWVESKAEISDTVKSIQEKQGEDKNIFFAISSYISPVRKGRVKEKLNVDYRRCLYLDLDVDLEKAEAGKTYKTKQDAIDALTNFIKNTGMPDPVWIDSGNGIHAYYLFDEDIPITEWEPYAKKFLTFCQNNNLLVDESVMCDISRIMRCPDTINNKPKRDKAPAKIMSDELVVYKFGMFKEILGEVELSVNDILKEAAKLPMSDEEKKAAKLDNFKVSFDRIAKESIAGTGCAQIDRILRTKPNDVEYDEWFSILSIAQHCEDRAEAIHELSKGHNDYSPSETEFKANETQGKPHTCEQFSKYKAGLCDGCKFKGNIKSPINMFREFIPAPIAIVKKDEGGELTTNKEFVGLPSEIAKKGWSIGANSGGIYYQPPVVHDEEGNPIAQKPVLALKHLLYPIRRIYCEKDGEMLDMKAVLPSKANKQGNERIFRMKMNELYDLSKFKEIVTKNGIIYDQKTKQGSYIMDYIYEWADWLIDHTDPDMLRKQLGWADKCTSYVFGKTEIRNVEGQIIEADTALAGNAKTLAKYMEPTGSYDEWKKAAQKLNQKEFELHAFVLMTGFASPLFEFLECSTPAITITLYNTESGTAKTGAAFGSISIWGHPKPLHMVGTKDGKRNAQATPNALNQRIIALKNVPFLFDEMGNQNGEETGNFIHNVSQGKPKVRMEASVDEERPHEGEASMVVIFTSNHSVITKLAGLKIDPNGELARVLEFKVGSPSLLKNDALIGAEIFNPFTKNYGHAGREYIRYLMETPKEKIKARFDYWVERFMNDYSKDAVYRFYHNAIACTFTGAEIANDLGIIDYDLERIYNHVVNDMINTKNNVIEINKADYVDVLQRFLNSNHLGTLTIEDGNASADVRASHLVIRADIDKSLYNIETRAFAEFLAKEGASVDAFIENMNKLGYKTRKHKKRMGAQWKPAASLGAVSSIEIESAKFLDEIVKEINAENK